MKKTKVEDPSAVEAKAKKTRTARTNFPDKVKAQIFARDRAICGFTGLSTWLLDEGACGFYNVEWIDHVTPSTKGGLSTEENGITSHWAYNYNKSDNTGANLYLFDSGYPTNNFWVYHRTLTPEMAQRIARFAQLHPSDWYFNKAVKNVLWGVDWLHSGKAAGYSRGDDYRAGAALKRVQEWKRLVEAEGVTSLEDRELVLEPPMPDRTLLLSLRDMTTTDQIKELMQELLPYHAANFDVIDTFQTAYLLWLDGDDTALDPLYDKVKNPLVNQIVRQNTLSNISLLFDPYDEWASEENAVQEQTEDG